MNLFYRQHGAVSIFLVIILVPVIMLCSIYVDVSRVWLAKGQTSAAGDLALNTVMSNYDVSLNDYYGMMASCQNINDFYTKTEKYYEATLISSGMDTTNASSYASNITAILKDDADISDMLQISILGGAKAEIGGVKNANLGNPAMLRKEIVEFMRYRTPINGIMDFIKSLEESKDAIDETKDDTELISKKQDFYSSENEVLNKAHEIYELQDEYKNLGLNADSIKQVSDTLESVEDKYKGFHVNTFKNLYNTQGIEKFQSINIKSEYTQSEIHALTQYDIFFQDDYIATAGDFQKFASEARQSALDVIAAESSMKNEWDKFDYNNAYDIQFWAHELKNTDVKNKYAEFCAAMNDMVCKNYAMQFFYEEKCQDIKDETISIQAGDSSDLKSGTGSIKAYKDNLSRQLQSKKNEYTKSGSTYATVGGKLSSISGKAIDEGKTNTTETNQGISEIYSVLKSFHDKGKQAKQILEQIKVKLGELESLKAESDTKLQEWEDKANSLETEMAGTDRDEISNLKDGKKASADNPKDLELYNKLTAKNIQSYSQRVSGIVELFDDVLDSIDKVVYNKTKVREINDYSTFKDKSGIKEKNIVVDKDVLETNAKDSFVFSMPEKISWKINDANNPDMDNVAEPATHKGIRNYFKDLTDNSKGEEKKNIDKSVKKSTDNVTDEKKYSSASNVELMNLENKVSSGKGIDKTATDASKDISNDMTKVSDFVSGLFGDFSGTMAQAGRDLRDCYYTTDYIMNMFSYDTFEKEADVEGNEKQTLTNKPISADNNSSYLNEVEYILYGGSNNANKAQSYGTIFLLRLALNLPADYQYYMSPTGNGYAALTTIAAGICAASFGIIPEGLAHLALFLALTVAESVSDINTIKEGKRTKLIKGKGDLTITVEHLAGDKLSAIKNLADGSLATSSSDEDKFPAAWAYSDYLKLILLLKLMGKNADYIYLRTGDVIQANMIKNGAGEGYRLDKAQVYFYIASEMEVSPLMLSWSLMTNEPNNPYQEISWRSFSYKTIRGY